MNDKALRNVTEFWEHLTLATLARLEEVYTHDAYFEDPFNEVQGVAEIRRVFAHMFETLHEPRFTILETISQGSAAMLVWDFDFRIKSHHPEVKLRIHGASHLRFALDGRVSYHRDYWDAANELYSGLPVIGVLMRYLRKRMKAP